MLYAYCNEINAGNDTETRIFTYIRADYWNVIRIFFIFFFFYFFFISTFSFFIIEFPKIKPNVNKVVLNIYILEAKQKIKL